MGQKLNKKFLSHKGCQKISNLNQWESELTEIAF